MYEDAVSFHTVDGFTSHSTDLSLLYAVTGGQGWAGAFFCHCRPAGLQLGDRPRFAKLGSAKRKHTQPPVAVNPVECVS